MPDSGGVFTRTDGTFTGSTVWTQEKNAANLVTAAHFDTHDQDIANALNNRVFKDGTTTGTVSLNLLATTSSASGVITIGGVNFVQMPTNGSLFLGNAGNPSAGTNTNVIGIGSGAMPLVSGGSSSVGIGNGTGAAWMAPLNSVALGSQAASISTAPTNLTAIGARALQSANGSHNTGIGFNCGGTLTSGSNCIVIGEACDFPSASANGQINIGCAIFGTGANSTGATAGTGKIGINNPAPTYTFDVLTGNVGVGTTGFGLRVKEGSNCKQGTATLSSGTVTVANTSVTTSSRILISGGALNASTAIGMLSVPTITGATSFVITSYIPGGTATQTGDLRTVNYEIFEPY